eukprot:376376_1
MSADIVDFDDELEDNDNIQEPPFKKQKFDDEIAIDEDNLYTQTLTNTNRNSLDDLSEDLIAYIASHLQLYDYINFSKCNRLIYISVRSKPISISHATLGDFWLETYSSFVENKSNGIQKRLKMIKGIRVQLYDEFEPTLFSNIQELSLVFTDDKEYESEQEENIIRLLNDMNTSQITKITVEEAEEDDTENILKLLKKMHNVQYISLLDGGVESLDRKLSNLYDSDLLKNIKGLMLLNDYPRLLSCLQNQLESLHIQTYCDLGIINDNKFMNLKELCIYFLTICLQNDYSMYCDYGNVYKPFLECLMLQRVHITIRCCKDHENKFEDVDLEFFEQLWSIKSLNFISVYKEYFSSEIVDKLIAAVCKHQRIRLKIRVAFHDNVLCSDTADKIFQLVMSMRNNSKHFMLIFEFLLSDLQKLKCLFGGRFKEEWFIVNWMNESRSSYQTNRGAMIVSNKYCNICGYTERWIYIDDGNDCVIC